VNFSRFSQQSFEDSSADQLAARKLCDELQTAVASELHQVVVPAFEKIIRELNLEGHRLLPVEVNVGDIAFRDEPVEAQCRLRLGCDVVISAGYADLQSDPKSVDEIVADVTNSLRRALTNPPHTPKSSDQ
jgi:hypothetical protein